MVDKNHTTGYEVPDGSVHFGARSLRYDKSKAEGGALLTGHNWSDDLLNHVRAYIHNPAGLDQQLQGALKLFLPIDTSLRVIDLHTKWQSIVARLLTDEIVSRINSADPELADFIRGKGVDIVGLISSYTRKDASVSLSIDVTPVTIERVCSYCQDLIPLITEGGINTMLAMRVLTVHRRILTTGLAETLRRIPELVEAHGFENTHPIEPEGEGSPDYINVSVKCPARLHVERLLYCMAYNCALSQSNIDAFIPLTIWDGQVWQTIRVDEMQQMYDQSMRDRNTL